MEIYGLARVSGKIQIKNNSFADQEKQMREKYGDALKFYKEQYTGSTTDRPVLNEVMGMLKPGDIFVVTKLDRLARTTIEGLELIQKLFSMGVTVHILNIGILENTSMGQFFVTCLLAVAELERVMIIERMMSGREIARLRDDYREGRPKVYKKAQVEHALALLESHSYSEVSELTGMSVSTLTRAKRKAKVKEVEKAEKAALAV